MAQGPKQVFSAFRSARKSPVFIIAALLYVFWLLVWAASLSAGLVAVSVPRGPAENPSGLV